MSTPPPLLPLVARRMPHLRRGINLSHWFSQVFSPRGYTAAHFDSWITAEDMLLIKSVGFDHVRFPIAPEPILNEDDPTQLPSEYLARLDHEIQLLLEQDLAVIVDLHPEAAFKKALAHSDARVEAFISFWETLAAHFSKFDPERVLFEVLNEPEIHDPKRWNQIQNRAVEAIRRSASTHTIVISGDDCSQLPMLQLLEPPPDRNLICNFHLYDPIVFTHQGASWSPPWAMACKGMLYPSDPVFIREFLETVDDPQAVRKIGDYRDVAWSAARYEEMAAEASAWARGKGLALSCNEFGVYKDFAPRDSRLLWLQDVVRALENHQIAWTLWDYAGSFAVVNQTKGTRTPDAALLAALGLAG
jgi:endoglucanase